jgi:hypothetical protein
MQAILELFFGNLGFIMLLVGLSVAAWRVKGGRPVADEVLKWSLVFGVGFSGVYTGVMHIAIPEYSAKMIGWQNSPFQLEVGAADLAIGVAGLLALWGNYGFRLAVVVVASIFYGIDAIGHVHQMIVAENFAPGNAGSWFWLDILLPAITIGAAAAIGLRGRKSDRTGTAGFGSARHAGAR